MIPAETIPVIKKQLRKGYPHGEIITELEKEGYSREEIEKAMLEASGYKGNQSNNNDTSVWIVLGAGLGITGISLLSVFRNSTLGTFFLAAGVICFVVSFVQQKYSGKGN